MKKAEIYVSNQLAGILIEDENGFSFTYTDEKGTDDLLV